MQHSLTKFVLLAIVVVFIASPAFSFIDEKYRRQVSVSEDLNADGYVNGVDLGLVLGRFNQQWDGLEDLNGDGVINSIDLGLLLGGWSSIEARVSLKHNTGDLKRRNYFVNNVVTLEPSPFDKGWTRVWVKRGPGKAVEGFDIHLRFEDMLTILWMRGWNPA